MTRFAQPCVYAISSRQRLAPAARTTADEIRALEGWLASTVAAGVDLVQIRERDLGARLLCGVCVRAVRLAAGTSTRILVNDRPDVAMASLASGVHLPAAGLPAAAVSRLGPSWLIGRSVHDADKPREEELAYVLYGTVFPSRSKSGLASSGLAGLRQATVRWSCPVIAIGGLSPGTARLAVEHGAAGVAGIGVFLPAGTEPESLGPMEATRRLREAMRPRPA